MADYHGKEPGREKKNTDYKERVELYWQNQSKVPRIWL